MTKKFLPLPKEDDALIRRSDLPNYLPIAAQTLARWASESHGPSFIKLGRRLVAYRVGDYVNGLSHKMRKI